MIRQAARGALALFLVAAALDTAGAARQSQNLIQVVYRDRTGKDTSEKTATGDELKLTPTGLQVLNKGSVVATVSPADIVRVDPGDVEKVERNAVLDQLKLERERKWEPARVNYEDMRKKAKTAGAPAKTIQFLEFRLAYATGKAADDIEDDSFAGKADAAQKMLGDYLITYPGGWEVWPATRMRAWLLVQLDKPADAAEAWSKLAKAKDLPAALQQEAALNEIDCLIRGKRYNEANDRIAAWPKTDTGGPARERVTIYERTAKAAGSLIPGKGPDVPVAQFVKPVQDAVDAAKDPVAKAVGYNMLGELCMAAEKPREAMWSYLWVEVVYNQDRDEVAKAMVRLVKAFEAQQDEERTKTYRQKLRQYRSTML